jgi:hypothetical protein
MNRPLRPESRAGVILARIERADTIGPVINRPYLIKHWLDRDSVSVVYGDANVGKSFFALNLAHHVQEGRPWCGCKVQAANVLYIAAEGGALFDNRVAALDGARFWVLKGGIALGPNGDARALAEALCQLAAVHGPFGLVIVDTLARAMGAGDENAAPDIAMLLRGIDLIREATGAHVMLIHHTGKDAARGARGHSSLRAAIDTEIAITRDEYHVITAEAVKQRDMPTGRQFRYRLHEVILGHDADGDMVTTCVVDRET